MKLAFVLPSLSNNGPNVFTLNLIEGLIKYSGFKPEQIQVFYFKGDVELKFPCETEQIKFFSMLDLASFDVIHSTMLKPDLYLFTRKWLLKDKTLISGIHNDIPTDLQYLYGKCKGKLLELLWFLSLKSIRNAITSSYVMDNKYKKEYGLDLTTEVITYGIERKDFLLDKAVDSEVELKKFKEKYRVIGSCGLLIRRKGFHLLLDFLRHHSGYGVVIVGDGELREELQQLAKNYGVTDQLMVVGFQENSIRYYRYFDIYAMTSFSEGFGLAMLDALSIGLPLVCSDLDIYSGFFDDKTVGLFKTGDAHSLGVAIEKVGNNLEVYSKASNELFSKYFTLSSMAKKHADLYRRLVDK